MAGIKISELPEASALAGNEIVAIVQNNCTKFVSASAIGGTVSNDIAGIITGCGLVGGGTSGTICVAIDNNCFDSFVNTTTTVEAFSGSWDQSTCAGLACTGALVASDISGLTCCQGTVIASDIAGLDQSACAGILCTGTVVAGDIAGLTSCTGTVVAGDIAGLTSCTGTLVAGNINGTDDVVAKFNAAGDSVEDSCITDTGSLVTISIDTQVTGDLITGGSGHSITTAENDSAIIGGVSNTIGGTACCGVVVGGGSNQTTAQGSVTIGGAFNCTTAKWSSTIAGALNKVCGAGEQAVVLGGCTNIAKHNSAVVAGGTNMTSVSGCMLHTDSLYIKNLPVSDPQLAGVIWSDGGTLKVSAG